MSIANLVSFESCKQISVKFVDFENIRDPNEPLAYLDDRELGLPTPDYRSNDEDDD